MISLLFCNVRIVYWESYIESTNKRKGWPKQVSGQRYLSIIELHDVNIYFYSAIVYLKFLYLVYVFHEKGIIIYLYFFIFSLCRHNITISLKTIRLKIRKWITGNWDTICFRPNCFTSSSPILTKRTISRGSLRLLKVTHMWVISLAAIFRLEYDNLLHNLGYFFMYNWNGIFPLRCNIVVCFVAISWSKIIYIQIMCF